MSGAVNGVATTEFCDEHRLRRRASPAFIESAGGAHAHQKGLTIATSSHRSGALSRRTTATFKSHRPLALQGNGSGTTDRILITRVGETVGLLPHSPRQEAGAIDG